MSRYNPTERAGVNAVEAVFINDFEWVFREQPIVDVGIDATIEIAISNNPTGTIGALQIKSGPSHFVDKGDHYVFYIHDVHYQYWRRHSLPVLIVGYLPASKEVIFQFFKPEFITATKKQGWKLTIPKSNILNADKKSEIERFFDGGPEENRRRKLFLYAHLIEYVGNGGGLYLYSEEWVNKSLGRGPFRFFVVDEKGEEQTLHSEHLWYTYKDFEQALQRIYPWASAEIDHDYYDENLDEVNLSGMYNVDWLKTQKIYPYDLFSNEVAAYRLKVTLNKLGEAFLEVAKFIKTGEMPAAKDNEGGGGEVEDNDDTESDEDERP